MSAKFKWSVATPDGVAASGESVFLIVPTTNGELGIMAGHAALVSSVSPGEMRVTAADDEGIIRAISVGAGVVDVRDNTARVMVTHAGALGSPASAPRAASAEGKAPERA